MRKRKVVVDGITCPDEKIGLQLLHGGEGGIAEALVLLRCGYRPAAVGDAGLKGWVVHATTHDERHA